MNKPFSDLNQPPATQYTLKPAPEQAATADHPAFNDAIRHGDTVQGVQAPKRIDPMPRRFRNSQRIRAIVSLSIFASFFVYEVIRIVKALM